MPDDMNRKALKASIDDWKARVKRMDAAEAYLATGGFVLEDGPFDAATWEWFGAIAEGRAEATDSRWKAPPKPRLWEPCKTEELADAR